MESKIALDLDWNSFDLIIKELAQKITADGLPDVIVGILRGGLVPAIPLSHALDVRDIRALDIRRTLSNDIHADKNAAPTTHNRASLGDIEGLDVLLVDDVVGSGLTIRSTKALVQESGAKSIRSVTCILNEINWERSTDDRFDDVIDYVGTTCRGWVRFPWEQR